MLVKKPLPEADYLRKVLSYDADTGTLTWLARPREHFKTEVAFIRWNKLHVGRPAFASVQKSGGYATGALDGKGYYGHRIVWKHVHGLIPDGAEIDHINGVRHDNRLCNLRTVSRLENTQNRKIRSDCKHGFHGIHWHDQCQKWKVSICSNKKRIYIGVFADFDEAVAARRSAEIKYGFHPNHGRDG